MKHLAIILSAAILTATQAFGAPSAVEFGRSLPKAAQKGDLKDAITKAFSKAVAGKKDSKAIKNTLFEYSSAVGAMLPTFDPEQVKAAVGGVMESAKSYADIIAAADKLEGDAATENLGKCYAIAAAALANVLPLDGIGRDVAAFVRELVPAEFADQVTAAMENPAEALGAVRSKDGKDILEALRGEDANKPKSSVASEYTESLTITTSTTTTTTTTTTSTTQIVIVVEGQLVDPITLLPIMPPPQPGRPGRPHRPPHGHVVPPTRPSPTPVGRR